MPALTGEYRCTKCRLIPYVNWDHWIGPHQYDLIDHHPSVQALSDSASLGCGLCKVFWWSLFEYSDGKALYDAHDLPEGACTVRVSMLPTGAEVGNPIAVKFSVGGRNRVVFVKEKRIENGSSPWTVGEDDDMTTVESTLDREHENGDGPTSKRVRLFETNSRDGDLASLVDDVIQPLISTCRSKHERCQSIDAAEDLTRRPTRLIDVSDPDRLFLRQTVTDLSQQDNNNNNTSPPPYLILSYCWGGSNKGMTTWANVQSRHTQGFRRDEFSQTIQDAMELTRRLDIKYLWIDALCIIQPQEGAGLDDDSDWRNEAPRMGYYYRNALCTIAASRARKGDQGFLGERLTLRHGGIPQPCIIGTRTSTDETKPAGTEDFLALYAEHISWEKEFPKQPLMTRGWCFQEWLLSRRVLHFSRNGFFWECRSLRGASEDDDFNREDVDDKTPAEIQAALLNDESTSEDVFLATRRILDAEINVDELPYLWACVLRTYSRMDLSHETDRLIAVHSVATKLMNKVDTLDPQHDYSAGVFRLSLAGLLWSGPSVRRGTMNNNVPSWSWASAPGQALTRFWYQTTKDRPSVSGYVRSLVSPVAKDDFPGGGGFDFVSSIERRKLKLRATVWDVDFGDAAIESGMRGSLSPGKTNTTKSKLENEEEPASEEEKSRAASHAEQFGKETRFSLEFDATYLVPTPTVGKLKLLLVGYNKTAAEEQYPKYHEGMKMKILGLVVRPAIVPAGEAYLRVGFVIVTVMEDGFEALVDESQRRDIVII